MALYRRTRSTRVLVMSLVMASLITITIDFRGGRNGPFESAGSKIALTVIAPLQSGVSRAFHPVASFFSGLAHVGSLESDNRALRAENERIRAQSSKSVSTQRELARLQALFKLQQSLGLKGVAARVVGESVSNFEWTVTIDRGSSDGVKAYMPVVAGEGLVGNVIQVASHWSKVMLVIDPRSAVAARLAGSGETGLVTGQRARPLSMDLVNPEATVSANEQVVTSGYQGGLYPPEILIGFVSSEYTRPGSLTKSILVRPAVDFSSLEFVDVITGKRANRHG
ncbi:MAG TPA: rod shape-determining protein MreC [Actinomycetota bacterium]